MVQAGQYVTDGTAVFLVTDIRDGSQVGDIKLSPVLRKGYVKANGALLTSARANYPRLITFLTENPSLNAGNDTAWNANKALYVYNSSADTLRVPDATGRVLQGGTDVESVEAGLPNITGSTLNLIDKTGTNIYGTGLIGQLSVTSNVNSPYKNGAFILHGTNASYANGRGSGTTAQADRSMFDAMDFNASRSNPIYGSSTTVQPPALTMISQIKY